MFAGDYIEATAELVAIGKTSRKIQFEARKVDRERAVAGLAPERGGRPRCSPSSSRARSARASSPTALQRRPATLYMPGLPAGPAPAKRRSSRRRAGRRDPHGGHRRRRAHARADAAPARSRPQEVADEAARCRDAGAAVIHLHVRNDDGSNTQSSERFAEVIDAIRASATASSSPRRAAPSACRSTSAPGRSRASPRWPRSTAARSTSATTSSSTRAPTFASSPPGSAQPARVAELECYEVGHVEEALALVGRRSHRARRCTSSSCWASRAPSARAKSIVRWMRSLRAERRDVGRRRGRPVATADDRAGDAPRRARARRPRGQHLSREGRPLRGQRAARRARRGPTRGRSGATPADPARARTILGLGGAPATARPKPDER